MKKPRSENAIDYTADNFAFAKNAPVRLSGRDMDMLRLKCFQRDRSRCRECRKGVSTSLPAWHPLKANMAHIQGQGANGSDELSNVLTLCHDCHMANHNGKTLRCMEEARAQLTVIDLSAEADS